MNTLRRISIASLILGFASLAGCAAQGGQPDARTTQAAQDDISALHNQYLKAFNAKDAAGIAATYTTDAILMPPNFPAVKTAIAIETYERQELQPPVSGLLLNVAETVVTSGDTAYSSGYYTLLGENNSTLDHGKFLEVLKHTEQGWKIHRDSYNSDGPATPAPAAATH